MTTSNNSIESTHKPTSRCKRFFKTAGIVVAVIVMLIILFVSVVFYATSGLVTTVGDQLAALRAGDIAKAYTYTAKGFQQSTSLDNFKKFLGNYPTLTNNKSFSFSNREIKSDGIGKITGTLTANDNTTTPISYELIKEGDVWKILMIRVNPQGAGIKENLEKSD
jgi:hypothetical protein